MPAEFSSASSEIPDAQILEAVLTRFSKTFPAFLIAELRDEISMRYTKRLKNSKVYKYEQRFLEVIATRIIGRHFSNRLCDEILVGFRKELARDFTRDNVLLHYNLAKRGLLRGYFATFLRDLVGKVIRESLSSILQSGRYIVDYHGNFSATTSLFRIIAIACYEAAFTEVAETLQAQGNGLPDLSDEIAVAASTGLQFRLKGDQFGYVQPDLEQHEARFFGELLEEAAEAKSLVQKISNQHPRLFRAFTRYEAELQKNDPDLVRLMVYGGDIQTYMLRHHKELSSEVGSLDDAPAVSNRLVDSLDALMVRHAMVILSSPDISDTVKRYEELRNFSKDNKSPFRPFEMTVNAIASADILFNNETRVLAHDISVVETDRPADGAQEAAAVAMTRGSLAAFGSLGKEILRDATKEKGKELVKEGIDQAVKNEALRATVRDFLSGRAQDLAEIVARYPTSLGWIASVLRMFL